MDGDRPLSRARQQAVGCYNQGMADGRCQCPKIDLAEWKDREVSLAGHSFLTRETTIFLHVPHRLQRDLESLWSEVDGVRYKLAGAPLVMHRDAWFSGEILVSVDPESGKTTGLRGFENLFYSRVVERPGFDAALREMPRFYRDLRAARVGRVESMYFWYVSCPRCVIEQGPRQVILLARSNKVLVSQPCPLTVAAGPAGRILPCGV